MNWLGLWSGDYFYKWLGDIPTIDAPSAAPRLMLVNMGRMLNR